RHGDAEAVALLVEQPVAADERVLDDDVVRGRGVEAELLLVTRDAHVLGVEHERAHAARAGRAPVGAREEEERARMARVRDPLLRAGDAPAVAVRLGARPQSPRVRARLGLGERERTEVLAACERRHEARLLLVGAEREQRQRGRARVHRNRDADACVRARELLEDEHVRQEVGAGAAVLLRHARPHEAELRELTEELAREATLAVPLGGMRLDLVAGELPGELLDLLLLRAELEIHAGDFSRRLQSWSSPLPRPRRRSSAPGALRSTGTTTRPRPGSSHRMRASPRARSTCG